jgi:GAF domain-containing protein
MSEPDATRLDPARLAALRETGLLDSAPEEAFDALTRLAARLVGVPAAFVSLVDEDRDFYKSCVGFGEPLATVRQLEGTTFCHFAIQSPTPLVIPDTRADPRFATRPHRGVAGGGGVRGRPHPHGGGQVLGSFCAIDFQPRAWTEGEIEILRALGGAVEREIGLRGALASRSGWPRRCATSRRSWSSRWRRGRR